MSHRNDKDTAPINKLAAESLKTLQIFHIFNVFLNTLNELFLLAQQGQAWYKTVVAFFSELRILHFLAFEPTLL